MAVEELLEFADPVLEVPPVRDVVAAVVPIPIAGRQDRRAVVSVEVLVVEHAIEGEARGPNAVPRILGGGGPFDGEVGRGRQPPFSVSVASVRTVVAGPCVAVTTSCEDQSGCQDVGATKNDLGRVHASLHLSRRVTMERKLESAGDE